MLPKLWRLDLRQQTDFFTTCRAISAGPLTVFYRPVAETAAPQWAVIVKKTLGGAVVRQKSRRRVRSAIAQIMQTTPLPTGVELVVLTRRLAAQKEYVERLQTALQQLAR
jgi:ribonuclease P protein component